MSMAPRTAGIHPYQPEPGSSLAAQPHLIVMGRQDYISVLLRLIGLELYKLRRRVMAVVLGTIGILAVIIAYLLIALLVAIFMSNTATQAEVNSISTLLRLPISLYVAELIISTLGQVLIVILVGTIVGGEYGVGTIRLLYTRGPARSQFLCSKIGAAIFCIAAGVLGMTLLGILMGQLLNIITGIASNFDFFNAAWLAHALIYLLITSLGLFVYAMMALFIATLGRSSAAGIGGALVWIYLAEPVLKLLSNIAAITAKGATADFARALPDYLISSNIAALQQNQNQALFGDRFAQFLSLSNPSPLSDLHALLVLAGYLILFIGLAWWINERRDITS
jgi:ABC-type transport system involved in multi-copper enzyme maturation permease subunit